MCLKIALMAMGRMLNHQYIKGAKKSAEEKFLRAYWLKNFPAFFAPWRLK
jgi:hypothetical protein